MPDPQKRKKPPTFHHYPPDRARKLKKEWVERAKIKSRWKAQKRREGIVSLRSGKFPQEGEDQRQELDEHGHDTHSDSDSDSDSAGAEQPGTASGSPPPDDSNEPSSQSSLPRLPGPRQKLTKRQQHPRRNSTTRDATTSSSDDKKQSVRDLFQKAYSKSSLHTYKSDPFQRGRNQHHDRGRGSSSNTRGRGNNAPSRGRGQPNMKLRMNAMLAKITEQTKAQ